MVKGDIKMLPSSEQIAWKLPGIFVDSVLVDMDFKIEMVSQNVLDLLNFSFDQLQHKNLGYILQDPSLVDQFKEQMEAGCFDETEVSVHTSTNEWMQVTVAGFHIGRFGCLDDVIAIRIKNVATIRAFEEKRGKKTVELDNFIYRTAHDLRGPLATMKGLINLIKLRENDHELDRLHLLLEAHANRLDERLFQLLYLAESGQHRSSDGGSIDFSKVETQLRRIIEQNAFLDFLEFHFSAPSGDFELPDSEILTSLLSNLLLYFLSLPMDRSFAQLFLRIESDCPDLTIDIGTQGFRANEAIQNAIDRADSLYTDIINYPELLNFYAARKVTIQLGGSIQVKFIGGDNQRLTLRIPARLRATCSE